MAEVEYRSVSRTFPGSEIPAVSNLNLKIESGELLVLVGPSGSGKSTALRILAGLEPQDEGSIHIDDKDVSEFQPQARDIAMVFQNYALYPQMTVAANMGFALKQKKIPKAEREKRVLEAAKILDLVPYLDRKPKNLSGGQRQRVAMGRAIVREPKVFLMDEPLSNLDAKLRVQTRAELSELQERLKVTTVYVTHDQVEAMTMGDRVAVLDHGVLQQVDKPSVLYSKPSNKFVAGFIGSPAMNFFDVTKTDNAQLMFKGSEISLKDELQNKIKKSKTSNLSLGVRPEHLKISDNGIAGKVRLIEALGSESYIHVSVDDAKSIIIRVEGNATVKQGELVNVSFGDTLHVFNEDGSRV